MQNAKYDIQVCQPPESKGSYVLNANCNQTKKQEPRHYGSKQGEIEKFDHKLSHKLRSEQSERANEWAQWSVQAKWAEWSKQMSEWCVRTSKRTSEWLSTNILILGLSEPQCARVYQMRLFCHHSLIIIIHVIHSVTCHPQKLRFLLFESNTRLTDGRNDWQTDQWMGDQLTDGYNLLERRKDTSKNWTKS